MYIGAAVYRIHATVINCTLFNMLRHYEQFQKMLKLVCVPTDLLANYLHIRCILARWSRCSPRGENTKQCWSVCWLNILLL